MDNILSYLINMLRTPDPMGADPNGVNPAGVEGANYSANQIIKYVPKEEFGKDAVTTGRIQADLAGRPRPRESMNGIRDMMEAVDEASGMLPPREYRRR